MYDSVYLENPNILTKMLDEIDLPSHECNIVDNFNQDIN